MKRRPIPRARVNANPVTGMNDTETDYGKHLNDRKLLGEVVSWDFNAVRFHLGGGAWYKPDFLVVMKEGYVELHETKGYWREAARVRIKVAASRYPAFRFVAVKRQGKRSWQYEEISPA